MPLTKEQVAELKTQLREQIKDLPSPQKEAAEKQIAEMSDDAIEMMLKQQQSQSQDPTNSPFRGIVDGKIPSRIIDQNKFALAVLDIKPISKGHTIIIPKKQIEKAKDLPTQAFSLAKSLSKKIISKLKAAGTEIQTQFAFGEIIINVIPVYDKPVSINSPREETNDKELDETYKILRVIKKPKVIKLDKNKMPIPKKNAKKEENVIRLKRRIP